MLRLGTLDWRWSSHDENRWPEEAVDITVDLTDYYWLLLIITDYYWLLLIIADYYWLLLIITDCYWLLL